MDDRFIKLPVKEVQKETEKAFLVVLENDEEHWIPKSQMKDPDALAEGETDVEAVITEWIADQKGLLDVAEEINEDVF